MHVSCSLSTIHFYIILKQAWKESRKSNGLSTIHFYIILKRLIPNAPAICVWVPYISTSFSNRQVSALNYYLFEYHTFLHHSQTNKALIQLSMCLSTIHFYIILKRKGSPWCIPSVWVPYISTSFSNLKFKNEMPSFGPMSRFSTS